MNNKGLIADSFKSFIIFTHLKMVNSQHMHMYQFFTALVFVVLVSLSPECVTAEPYTFHKSITKRGSIYYTFMGQSKPRLQVEKGKTCDALSVNKALEVLNLPTVSNGGVVRSLLTGHRSHQKKYVWNNLSSRALTVVSTQCKDQSEPYECIWQVRI